MRKTFYVALREFLATVLTKGFMLGILLPPLLIGLAVLLLPRLMNQQPPRTEGRVAVIDRSGLVAEQIARELSPESIARRRGRGAPATDPSAAPAPPSPAPTMGGAAATQGLPPSMQAPEPALTIENLGPDADAEAAKADIPRTRSRERPAGAPPPRLALAIIPRSAVEPTGATPQGRPTFESFEVFSSPSLDIEVKSDIEQAVQRAIVDARLARSGLDVNQVRGLLATPQASSRTLTEGGERATNPAAEMLIPGAFLFLIWISVFTAGQYLLTSTIEEKSNRVMEVLLSAASPMQIMVGKIIGQMAVGAAILCLYAGVGIAALIGLAMADIIDPVKLLWLAVYFLIAFFTIASLMAAVGSAVSDVREAQSLIGPIMIVLVIPMMLWFPILRNPNSLFATVCSFIPPISPFIMVLRISGAEPVPAWQIPATIALGIAAAAAAAWAAAKVFRIGVLMYGKPPDLRTLVRWIRMA